MFTVNNPHLEVLDQVVEHTETFGVRALVDICERANLGSLPESARPQLGPPYLKGNVLLVYPDLELLATDNVLLGPRRIVFSVRRQRLVPPSTPLGHCAAHFVISLSRTIRFISSTTAGLKYTVNV